VVAAEPKCHAQTFVVNNRLAASHHFDDLAALLRAGPSFCSRCRKGCEPPKGRPDLFVAGFSCQPYSAMRAKDMVNTPPHEHPKFDSLPLVVRYLRTWQPRLVLLENTPGFKRRCHISGGDCSGLDWLQAELAPMYGMSHLQMDLQAWVNIRRPRIWIFLVHRDIGGNADALAAAASLCAASLEQSRARYPADSLQFDYMLQPGSLAWEREVLSAQAGASGRVISEKHKHNPDPSWRCQTNKASGTQGHESHLLATHRAAHMQRACMAPVAAHDDGSGWLPPPLSCSNGRKVRAAWRARRWPWSDHHPLATASLHGLGGTEREREVLEVFILSAAEACNVEPSDEEAMSALRRDLFADISQNISWLRPLEGHTASVFCRSSRVFSFGQGRLVLPQEQLAAIGWQLPNQPATRPCTVGLTGAEIQDLVGESQALPCLAAALWGLLLAAGRQLPGVWLEASQGSFSPSTLVGQIS